MTGKDDEAEATPVQQLAADYPGWFIQYFEYANLPWEARRMPFQVPAIGGITWLSAPSPERLRDLLDGAEQVEAQLAVEEAARARLGALQARLLACGFEADLDGGELTVTAPVGDGPRLCEVVTCRPRLDADGELWFFDGGGKPVEVASHVVDAVVVLGASLRRVSR
ncbi:hypothetical protein [Actinomadura geliboluensis]|uniref:hypothetical protein n=1 Tax=Actinomadura geliboluensis TaxID=882440 RepID=UPI0036A1658E